MLDAVVDNVVVWGYPRGLTGRWYILLSSVMLTQTRDAHKKISEKEEPNPVVP